MLHQIHIPHLVELLRPYARLARTHIVEVESAYTLFDNPKMLVHVDRIKVALICLTDGRFACVIPVSKLWPIVRTLSGDGWLSLSNAMTIFVYDTGQLVLDGQYTDTQLPVIDIRPACLPSQATSLSGATA